jgi:glycosyltransferase involved in cell wall biosynthesis
MRVEQRIFVIIPALNEAASIASVLDAIPPWVDERIVVDNGSEDQTREVALQHGARVIDEPQAGYGAACLRGMAVARDADIIVFLDADFSDVPTDMRYLVDPLIYGQADFVISDRTARTKSRQALGAVQHYGNGLVCKLIRLFWGHEYRDLGPFRAIRRSKLDSLSMADRDYGWTVEMQIRAIKHGLSILEVPVDYWHRAAGQSKISGSLTGIIRAGSKILFVVFRERMRS